ncbi:Lipoprotein-anchoring transpeptidase ErfK/SrfK [Rhizobium sp. RU33A]|uniref:L,D-transpeptidase n=1 Tax=Rhizobium sp. RU33A TaxID=1907413 RepID=UPI000955FEB8|nr:L,D-transpeptidase [Rhizobium sp. RU33A]SIR09781.1 Lipoprotein-anchoring transpeptidase ErfK/SrfK [Rhizobium sp. RU33A]
MSAPFSPCPLSADYLSFIHIRSLKTLVALGLVSIGLISCATTAPTIRPLAPHAFQPPAPEPSSSRLERYKALGNEPFPVPAVDTQRIGQQFLKQTIDYKTEHPLGTIVVDPKNRFLYLVKARGKAVRYGVGVGKAGFEFSGSAHIGFKRQWPRWTPTPDMLKRDPTRYRKWADGMDGSDKNPLGARALYLVKDGKDTLYRIHGTNEPWTIGTAASSGCIRMLNQDVIDLYNQVPQGSRVVVLGTEGA